MSCYSLSLIQTTLVFMYITAPKHALWSTSELTIEILDLTLQWPHREISSINLSKWSLECEWTCHEHNKAWHKGLSYLANVTLSDPQFFSPVSCKTYLYQGVNTIIKKILGFTTLMWQHFFSTVVHYFLTGQQKIWCLETGTGWVFNQLFKLYLVSMIFNELGQ